jgi:hypothetical protein
MHGFSYQTIAWLRVQLALRHEAGVGWLRFFPEWQTIQPKKDQWNWKGADALVENVDG